MIFRACSILLLAFLAGCNTPPANVQQPMTARPVENKVVPPADGAIFHAGINERPLFEDRRARNVGDILTINIVEKSSGNRKSSNSSSYSNSVDANIPTMTTNLPSLISSVPVVGDTASRILTKIFSLTGSAAGETTNDSSREAAGSASQDLTGTITVTVIEVLPNGNLLVSGEKLVALNSSNEVIRFSGVVNPVTITSANTVQSAQVADARLEYKGAGEMNEFVNDTRTLGFLGRFFLSVLPF